MKYILLLLFMLILSYIYILSTNESFNENQIIISKLGNKNGNGFFSNFFFTLNHYIYCNENKINFKIDSNNWLFKYKNGWSDYFIDNELSFYNPSTIKYYSVFDVLGEYTFQMYRDYIKKIYIYNNTTINKIINVKHKFNLIDEQYDSIFIRRGDKLSSESDYYHDNIYIQLLLIKNPNCKTIFLQTDDYNSYINLQKYITDNNLMINLYTLCDENNVGTIVHNSQKNRLNNATINNKNNKNYLSSIITKLNNSKSVEDMNNDEIYNHTLEMIIGIDIVIKSNICILDLQSNVSRFIKLSHNNPENVYDILNPDYQTNYNKIITPWNSL